MLFINDAPEFPMFYSLTDVPGRRWSWEEVPRFNLKSFCEIGIKLIQVDIAFDHIWKEDGKSVNYVMPPNTTWLLDSETGNLLFK